MTHPGRPGSGDLAGGDRPSTLPSRPGQGGGGEQLRPGDGNRPGKPGGGGDGPGRPGGGDRPGRPGDGCDNRPGRPGDRPDRPGQGGGGEQWRPGNGNGNRPLRPGDNGWANYRPGRINNWNQWGNYRHDNWNNINHNWNNHWASNWNNCNHWFNNDWWHNHPCDGWNWPSNGNWWAWAAWPAVTNWLPWGWNQPVYYNYGDNVYYDGDSVYYGDQQVATADEYAQQAEAIATSIPADVKPAPEDWMPLGVFAVTQDGESASDDPTMFLQLTVSKQGIIAGTLQNTTAGTVKSIEGMVDKETQRAAWTPEGETRPLMETGISNLTQDTTGVLVHFANGDTQQWMLARIDKPKEGGADTTK
jgi:hypothetical protein